MKDVKEYSVRWTHWDSNCECLKFDKVDKPSSSTIITANNYQYILSGKCTASNSHLKYITLFTKSFRPNQFYHQAGLISLRYSECVSNKHSIVPSAGP